MVTPILVGSKTNSRVQISSFSCRFSGKKCSNDRLAFPAPLPHFPPWGLRHSMVCARFTGFCANSCRLDCFSHSITIEVYTHRYKTAKISANRGHLRDILNPSRIMDLNIGGSKGEGTRARSEIFLISCSFWEILKKCVCWRPLLRVGAPPTKILDRPLLNAHFHYG